MATATDDHPVMAEVTPWLDQEFRSLCRLHADKQLPHAVLLTGAPGIGKHQLALAFAHSLLCVDDGVACASCHSCKLWAAGNHPDFRHLKPEEGKQVISIDQVRDLLEFAYKTPQIADVKVIVVWPADSMNRNAANALLKCLEEPPASTQFILSSANPGRLPATIRSRCQVVRVSEPDSQQARSWLQAKLSDAGLAQQYLRVSGGQPLLALERGEQLLEMHLVIIGAMQSAVDANASIVQLTKPLLAYDLKPLLEMYLHLVHDIVGLQLGHPRSHDGPEASSHGLERAWHTKKLLEHAQFVQNTLKTLHAGSHLNDQLMLEDLFLRLAICTQQD